MDLHDALTVARAALAVRNGPDDRRAHETICTFVQLIPREVLFAKVELEPRPKIAVDAAWMALRSVVGEEQVALADAANRALAALRGCVEKDGVEAVIRSLDIALGNVNPWAEQQAEAEAVAPSVCSECGGSGMVEIFGETGRGGTAEFETCPACGGRANGPAAGATGPL